MTLAYCCMLQAGRSQHPHLPAAPYRQQWANTAGHTDVFVGNNSASPFSGPQSPHRMRRPRTAFSDKQIHELEKSFMVQRYIAAHARDELAERLELTSAQVMVWFQNRRAKLKVQSSPT